MEDDETKNIFERHYRKSRSRRRESDENSNNSSASTDYPGRIGGRPEFGAIEKGSYV